METATALRLKPLMSGFGVEILDVDLARADAAALCGVVAAFHRHGAILLRGQKLSPPEQLAFTRQFGEPEGNARKEFCHPDFPEIYVISNKIVDGRRIGDVEAGYGWHTDFSYGARPAMCTMLHAMEVPGEGSDTLLADLCAAWNALPEDRQRAVDGKVIHHSYSYFMKSYRNVTLTAEQEAALPDVFHPVVRRHPADNRKALWVSTGTVKGIVGMPNPEGLDLIEELVAFSTQDRFVYRHQWQVGDVLVWDNRCTLHTGTPFDVDKYFRHVHRTWVKGDVPV